MPPLTPPSDDPFYESPYDPQGFDPDPETLPLSVVLAEAMHAHALALRVAMPATVAAVKGDQTVDVQPLFKARYRNQAAPTDLPILPAVPVVMPMGAAFQIYLPLSVGDPGWLMFADRSLEKWAASLGTTAVDPRDNRAHDLSDAVFLPGLVTPANNTHDGSSDLAITAGQAQLRLAQAGTIKLLNRASGQELMAVLDALFQQVTALANAVAVLTVGTGSGPSTPPVNVLSFTQVSAQVTALQQQLDTLKG